MSTATTPTSGTVTPERLASHGIASYVLSESCIRVQKRERIALDDALLDMENISRIFGVLQQTRPRIEKLRASQAQLRQQMQGNRTLPRVFVYDSGQEIPVTVGHFGMPQAMLAEAGASAVIQPVGLAGVRITLVGADGILGDQVVEDLATANAVVASFDNVTVAEWERELTSIVTPKDGHFKKMAGWVANQTRFPKARNES